MFSLGTFFCPVCGKEPGAEKNRPDGFWRWPRCPDCPDAPALRFSGMVLLVFGLCIMLFWSGMLCVGAEAQALILCAPFVAVGMMRLVQAGRLRRRARVPLPPGEKQGEGS